MKTKSLNTVDFTLNYENQKPSVKANIINKAIARVAVECTSIDELLERYETDILPEYNHFIRSTYALLPTHLPLCMLHDIKKQSNSNSESLTNYTQVCDFLTKVCLDMFPLKEV